ncbi:MAG: cellulase family glycosylhydrolase [Butyrivibrio sp.]|nr:cellulase family glycosylhydrolase [Butyrivibrio sp.]
MKKLYGLKGLAALLLAGIMCLSLFACSKENSTGDGTSDGTTAQQQSEAAEGGETSAESTEGESGASGVLMPEEQDKSTVNSIIPGRVEVDGTDFVVNGEKLFMNGVNTPWDKWNDFGGSFSSSFWNSHFAELHENGINAVRVWISCNGDVGISIRDDGYVVAAMPKHWKDLDSFFKAAEENGIYIMATLMSFDHYKDSNQKYASWRAMLDDESAMDSYVENYVIPFCKRYDSYDSLWSIDLCNEPDWIHENAECGKIPWNKLGALWAREAAAIHANSDILVTIGFGMIKYNSDKYSGNFGSDKYLQSVYDNELAYLDFYSPHFYEWEATWYGFPFDKDPVSFGLDGTKPMVIGEFPANGMTSKTSGSKDMSSSECYTGVYENGWNGIFAWTSNGVDDCGSLEDFVEGAKAIAEKEAAK